jgi:hypothetical protein
MALHARPHLETHFRKAGHSAVAGVAYRLGLRLYDRRTGEWHDYRRRKAGEEIVRALTIAPDGAPSWATDPEELWNRVEEAERRKDAQVARDYRIPVPFGLTDQQAGDLAEDMARFIATELHTAVSLGLHRDADVDALGNMKPPDKQGFHAHLYFPTRRLEEIQDDAGTSSWGLGAKLVLLSNKTTSGAFVEKLNECWAMLSNRHTAAQGLPADYTHLSYARQDLSITPQPTLGAAVTAMERRGFFTRRGDALRGDIMIPAKVYEAAHAIVLEEQHRQAVVDVVRETISETKPEPAMAEPSSIIPPPTRASVVLIPLLDGEPGSFVARFRAAAPIPETPETHQVLARVLRWVQMIQRVLGTLTELAARFRVHEEDRGRRMAAKLDTDFQLDQARAMRAATRQRLTDWEDAHPLLMFLAKKAGNEEGKPAPWRTLHHAAEKQDGRVQEIKSTLRRHQKCLDDLGRIEQDLKRQQVEQQQQLGQAVGHVQELSPALAEKLASVVQDDERTWLDAAKPVSVSPSAPEVKEMDVVQLRHVLRPRLSIRP